MRCLCITKQNLNCDPVKTVHVSVLRATVTCSERVENLVFLGIEPDIPSKLTESRDKSR